MDLLLHQRTIGTRQQRNTATATCLQSHYGRHATTSRLVPMNTGSWGPLGPIYFVAIT